MTHGSSPQTKPLSSFDAHVGQQVSFYRLSAKIGEDDLAKALGISVEEIKLMESGRRRAAAKELLKIGKLLRMRPCDFYKGLS